MLNLRYKVSFSKNPNNNRQLTVLAMPALRLCAPLALPLGELSGCLGRAKRRPKVTTAWSTKGRMYTK